MGVFMDRPFGLSAGRVVPHLTAVRVTPALAIVASSIANPTVLETSTPHHLVSGDTAAIAGHTGSTPAVDGSRVVTVIDATHVAVPVAVTVAGAGGTITREIARPLLTIDEGKLRAGLDWVAGDPRDALMTSWNASAQRKVEQDTGIPLLLTTFDVFVDALPRDRTPIALPWRPVVSIESIESIDRAGVTHTLDVATYHLDPGSAAPIAARVALSDVGVWPTDLRSFQPYVLRMTAGYPSVAALTAAEPMLVHLVGRLVAHYATLGRDLASVGNISAVEVPFGYEDDLAGYRLVTVA